MNFNLMIRKRLVFLLLGLVMVSVFSVPAIHAGGCERGIWACLNDPINNIIFGAPVYCMIGYAFCKKYVEN